MSLIIVCDGVSFDQKDKIFSVLQREFPEMSFKLMKPNEVGFSAPFPEASFPSTKTERILIGKDNILELISIMEMVDNFQSIGRIFSISSPVGRRKINSMIEILSSNVLLKEINWRPEKGANSHQRGYVPYGNVKTKGAIASRRLHCRRLMPSLSGRKTPVPKAQNFPQASARIGFKPHQMV